MSHVTSTDYTKHFSSETDAVRQALDAVRDRVAAEPGFDVIGDTAQIILGEVLNNVVEHAYRFEPGNPITMNLAFSARGLECHIVDEGVAMPDGQPPNGGMPDIDHDDRDALPEGGFGWAMVHQMTEDLSYRRAEGRNHLEFAIPLTETPPAN